MAVVTAEVMYALLAEQGNIAGTLERVLLGINWTVAETGLADGQSSAGLSFSPLNIPRNLPWSGSLCGRPVAELARWICSEDPCEIALGLAAVNAATNHIDNPLLRDAIPLFCPDNPHLSVFEHFAPQLSGAEVVVIGRYPNLDDYKKRFEFSCIERRPGPGDLPESAASWALPRADWVFITASSIANRTLPQLLALSNDAKSNRAKVVLMGPSLPWISQWADWGVDYLAGVAVQDSRQLHRIVAEAGGTRIFDQAVQYRLLDLS